MKPTFGEPVVGVNPGATSHQKKASQSAIHSDDLYKTEHVVDVQIEIAEDDWNTLRYQSRDLMVALRRNVPPGKPFKSFKADVTIDGIRIEGVGIRKKGFFGSMDSDRPSLKINFSKYNPDHKTHPPIHGVRRLTLNNNKQDPVGGSHLLGYEIFRSSGTVASRCNAAHVTVNGESLGIYSNVESVKPIFLASNFGDGSGLLYEGTVADVFTRSVTRIECKSKPVNHVPLLALADVLDQEELDLERLEKLIDIDAFIKFWATESLIGFWDGYNNDQNNYFVYQNPKNSKLYFLPWGVDCAFAENMPIPPFIVKPQFVYVQSRLANQLYRHEETNKKYHVQLQQLLDEHWDEERLLAKLAAIEERAEPFNTRKKETEDSLKRIRRFIMVRREKLAKEIEKGFEPKKPARIPPYTKASVVAKGSFDTKWYDDDPEEAKTVGSHKLRLKIRGESIEFRKVGVYAKQKAEKKKRQKKKAVIVFSGNRTNGKEVMVTLELSMEKFRPTPGRSIPIGGLLIDGKVGWLGTAYRPLNGKITFEKADNTVGAAVKGFFEVVGREFVDPNRKKTDRWKKQEK